MMSWHLSTTLSYMSEIIQMLQFTSSWFYAYKACFKCDSNFFYILPQIAKSESENRGLVKFNDLVEEGKKKFQRELESLMPDVKPGKGQRVCVYLFVVLHPPLENISFTWRNHLCQWRATKCRPIWLASKAFLSGRDIYHTIMLWHRPLGFAL